MPDHLHALPVGHLLGEYRIDDVLGSGGFGITYLAWDTQLEKRVAIKEYLPGELALRTDAATVHPKSTTDQADYQWGLDRFLDEARTLARFEHPHLNKVHRFFEANGTAYMVLEYIEGETLAARLKREGQLDAAHLRRLLDELLAGLEQVHAAGFVHRDIKPANIMLRSDGGAVLLDFGAARQAIGQRSKPITSILTQGYAPIEQYDQSAANVGPWTDLYALGMVAYCCFSNIREAEIPDAVARTELERTGEQHKALASAVEVGKGRYDAALLGAVDWALEVYAERRPRDVAAMRQALAGAKPDPAPAAPGAASRPPKPRARKTWRTVSLSALATIAVAATATLGWPIVQEQLQERQAKKRELLHWQEVRCNNAASLQEYLNVFPGGRYRQAAKDCLADIEANRRAGEERAAREKRKVEEERAAREKRKAEEERAAREKRKAEEERAAREKRKAEEERVAREKRKAEEERVAREKRKAEEERVAREKRKAEEERVAREKRKAEEERVAREKREAEAEQKRKAEAEIRLFTKVFGRAPSPDANDVDGLTDLHYAAAANMPELARFLLDAGAEVNARAYEDGEPFAETSKRKMRELTKTNTFDNWTRGGETPLYLSAAFDARETAELLIARGANVNAKTNNSATPLHSAAFGNARETAELLIARGANVNAKINSGLTPLHTAVLGNARETAELLIARDANVNAKEEDGWTPLHFAAALNARETAELLIARDANVNAKEEDGWTPLHYAAALNARETAELLIARAANVDARDSDGMTPLHLAANKNARETAELLIARGANVNAKADGIATPLHFAIVKSHREVAELLIAHGASASAKELRILKRLSRRLSR